MPRGCRCNDVRHPLSKVLHTRRERVRVRDVAVSNSTRYDLADDLLVETVCEERQIDREERKRKKTDGENKQRPLSASRSFLRSSGRAPQKLSCAWLPVVPPHPGTPEVPTPSREQGPEPETVCLCSLPQMQGDMTGQRQPRRTPRLLCRSSRAQRDTEQRWPIHTPRICWHTLPERRQTTTGVREQPTDEKGGNILKKGQQQNESFVVRTRDMHR